MDRSLKKMRREYGKTPLLEGRVAKSPFKQLSVWLKDAQKAKEIEPNAMCLSTSKAKHITSRIVLLRGLSRSGLIFYTNYDSEKGGQIRDNNSAALNFYWGSLARQIRIEGSINKLSAKESDQYFASRPREAQLAAFISKQSSVLKDRKTLAKAHKELLKRFAGRRIPRPKNWGGYVLIPSKFEFWQGQEHRLHDRIVYKRAAKGSKWKIFRLYP